MGGGFATNLMFNGSIYFVLYLQILRFYLVRQSYCEKLFIAQIENTHWKQLRKQSLI